MKAISLISALILVVLIVSILRMSPRSDPLPTTVGVGQTSLAPSTDDSSATTRPPPTTAARSTDNTVAPSEGEPEFILGGAVFGDDGYVVITNIGSGSGNIEGYALCQRPNYFVLPSMVIGPFESVWVAVGDGASLVESAAVQVLRADGQLGDLVAEDGEMALYKSAEFPAADQMVSYVEWGSPGHGRSEVAIAAELWTPDTFIEIPPDAFGVVAVATPPVRPADWTGWLGG